MKTILTNVSRGWNFIKLIRVLAGLFILLSGISDNNTSFIVLGSFFLLFSLFMPGTCCALYSSPGRQATSSDPKDVEYEEVGAK